MIILAIDTSCDDTCVAILEIKKEGWKILSNIVSSQVKIHQKWGGVYPTLAKREHQRNLPIVLRKALKKANSPIFNSKFPVCEQGAISKKNSNTKIQIPKIDLIAVTVGPGLEPCLWTGINFARALSRAWEKPLIPVNHIEAHIFANFIRENSQFPAVCLVVSGGHTQLILMKDFGKYQLLGETRDDAAGECFDKTARILGLGYPGGPAIAAAAAKVGSMKYEEGRKFSALQTSNFKIRLPRPMINQKNFDFSFSGLKTAVLYDFKNRSLKIRKSKKYIKEMAGEIQQAIIDVLISKTFRAAKEFKAKTIILGGGVVANTELRKQFKVRIKKEMPTTKCLIPDTKFCTDNATMIGIAGYFRYLKKDFESWEKITANANLKLG